LIETLKESLSNLFASGSYLVLPLAYVMGIFSSFLPCTYPVIPLTVAFLGAAGAGSKARAFVVSLVYVLGLTITYSTLAMVVILSARPFGTQVSGPWPFMLVGAIMIILALWMLGLFNVPIASGLVKAQSRIRGGRFVGALVTGAVAGLIVGPCSGPVLGAIIVIAAKQQNLALSLAVVVAYSMGLGTLFVLIGTFAGVLTSLPKAGPWMETVKKVFAVIIIAVGCGFFVAAGTRWESSAQETPRVSSGAPQSRPAGPEGSATASMPASQLAADVPVGSGVGGRIAPFKLPGYTLKPEALDPMLKLTGRSPEGISFVEADLGQIGGRKPVILVFWATWCTQCLEEVPHINDLAAKLAGRALVLGVNYKGDSAKRSISIAQKYSIAYPVLLDSEGAAANAVDLRVFPWVVVVDRTGVIRYVGSSLPPDVQKLIGTD